MGGVLIGPPNALEARTDVVDEHHKHVRYLGGWSQRPDRRKVRFSVSLASVCLRGEPSWQLA